jgi:uncharacterized protein YbjT (DUF2867 family)
LPAPTPTPELLTVRNSSDTRLPGWYSREYAGVAHFVYSSVGGAERSSGVPHFDSKWNIEQRIQKLDLPRPYCRRPSSTMSSTTSAPRLLNGQLVLGLWLHPEVRVQVIATSDIGAFAADAFDDPATWLGRPSTARLPVVEPGGHGISGRAPGRRGVGFDGGPSSRR